MGLFSPLPQDPPRARGELYRIDRDGQWHTLKASHETRPDGHDLPAGDDRVVLALEGVNSGPGYNVPALHNNLQSDLGQPILVVHEGVDANMAATCRRMGGNFHALKRIEDGKSVDKAAIFRKDPSVETAYNLLKQAMDQGRQVLLVTHSAGGMIGTLALNLLAQAGYKPAIGEHVRTLSMAGAGAPQDYANAGVSPDNVLHIGSHRDAVAIYGTTYVDPHHPLSTARAFSKRFRQGDIDTGLGNVHDINTIVPHHEAEVEAFLAGGPGGVHLD